MDLDSHDQVHASLLIELSALDTVKKGRKPQKRLGELSNSIT